MEQFHQLLTLSDTELQKTINCISDNVLLGAALSPASCELKEAFYRNMSATRSELIKQATEATVFSSQEVKIAQDYLVEISKEILN